MDDKTQGLTDSDTRRVFINKDSNFYQIFTFNQHKDGSIYCSFPNFTKAKWIQYQQGEKGPHISKLSIKENGKLSVHGSGRSSLRSHNNPSAHEGIVWGNYLLNTDRQQISARHLFSAYIEEPLYLPPSKAFNRKSDYSINTTDINPFVIIFFATPRKGLKLSMQVSFDMEDLESIPPQGGWDIFPLLHHDIFWYVYRAKNMNKWPPYTQVCYYDGYSIPMFFPQDGNNMRLDFRLPTYSISNNLLSISF